MDLCIYIPGDKATGKQIFHLLVSEVVDSQQWRISPSKFWQGVEDQVFYPLILVQITWNFIWVFIRVFVTKIYCQLLLMFLWFTVAALQNQQNYLKVGNFFSVVYSFDRVSNKIKVFSHLYCSNHLKLILCIEETFL